MYYIAQPPPLVGGSVVDPGALALPVPQGAQEEFGYRTTAGVGVIGARTGLISTGALASGTLYLSYFRSSKSQAVVRWDTATTSTPFAATPTLIRAGLYSVDDANNLVLLGASASDTTLGAVANTKFGKVFAAAAEVHFGQRYAWGFLAISATTMATLLGPSLAGSSNVAMLSDPRVNGIVSGQADLPITITAASVAASNQLIWAELS